MVIIKGSFVRSETHPEYGVGRVLSMDAFSTRVLFSVGGVRVYKNSDVGRIKSSTQLTDDERRVLEQKEASLLVGIVDAHRKPEPAAKKKRASR